MSLPLSPLSTLSFAFVVTPIMVVVLGRGVFAVLMVELAELQQRLGPFSRRCLVGRRWNRIDSLLEGQLWLLRSPCSRIDLMVWAAVVDVPPSVAALLFMIWVLKS